MEVPSRSPAVFNKDETGSLMQWGVGCSRSASLRASDVIVFSYVVLYFIAL